MQLNRRTLLATLAAQAGALATAPAWALSPTWIVVPYSAGGPADVTARKVAPLLQKGLGGTVLVDNVPGAGGVIGVQKVLAAPPDGQTIILGTITDSALSPMVLKDAKYQAEDLRMVGLLSQNPLVLLARPGLSVGDVKELVAYARKPGNKELFYGSTGPGSIFHLIAEDLAERVGIKLTQVPYKGLAPLVQDLMGGQIDLAFYPLAGNVFDLVREGKVKALGITGNNRVPQLARVPTFNETGLTKAFDYTMWPALFLPNRVPLSVAERINALVRELVVAPEFVKFCDETGTTAAKPMSLAETEAFFKTEAQSFRKVASALRLKPE